MRGSHPSDASLAGLMLSIARHIVPAQEAFDPSGTPELSRVARNREPGVGLEEIAKDFGIHFTTLYSRDGLGAVVRPSRGPSASGPQLARPV
jgi:hypothetical protein